MTNTSDTPPGADDATIVEHPETVEVQRVVTTNEPRALPDEVIPPHPGGPVDPLVPTVVTEDERVVVEPDGSVRRQAERVEYAPEKRRRTGLVPALLIVLAIALAAIAAAWYFGQSDTASVPSVTGLPLDAAVTRLEDDGFKADIVSQPNEAAQGIVFRQSPGAGSEQDKGSDVQLLVSKGPAEVTVPNAVGVPETEARDRLATAGLKATVVKVFSSSEIGNVIAQDPAAGGKAATGSEVRLNVSKGTSEVDVPSVIGLSQADATAQVKAAGLVANVVPVPSDQPAGIVVAQNPVGGQAARGSNMRLNVSSGP
jgi:serine/threonine-protein kinase